MSTTSSQTVQVVLPELGESVTEGVVVEWRIGEGDDGAAPATRCSTSPPTRSTSRSRRRRAAGWRGSSPSPATRWRSARCWPSCRPAPTGPTAARPPAPGAPDAPAPEADAPARRRRRGSVDIVLPDMESVTEGVVVEWRVAVGDAVDGRADRGRGLDRQGRPRGARARGRHARRDRGRGRRDLRRGTAAGAHRGRRRRRRRPPPQRRPRPPRRPRRPPTATALRRGPAGDLEWPRITPVARRLAADRGIDPTAVRGTGPGGMVRKADVLAAADGAGNGAGPAAPAAAAGEEAVPLRGPAAALAGYMDESLSIPTATSFRTLGVGVLDAQRRGINADLKGAGRDEKLSFTHLVAWALVRAAQAQPAMGTGYGVVDGSPHKLVRETVNLGLAVDVERKDGSRSLLVPVVRDAAGLGFRGFRDAYDDLVRRTRAGQVKPDELRGATISLTNPGGLGTVASVPRLMPGQGTIVATGAIGLPPGLAGGRRQGAGGARRREGHDRDQHLRPPGDPGRRERRVPGAHRAAAARRGRLLRGGPREPGPARRGVAGAPRPPPRAAPAPAVATGPGRRRAAGRGRGGHVDREGPPQPRPPGRRPRPARRQAARRPGAGRRERRADARGDGAHPRLAAAGEGAGRELRRRPPPPARGLLRHDRLRDRAHLRPPEAALAARRDRVGAPARAAAGGAAGGDPRAPGAGRRLRALPAPHLPRPEDLLDRGRGRPGADHRRGHRAGRRRGGQGGRDGHGPPRPARLHHPGRGAARASRSSPSSRATWPSRRARRTCARRPAT